MLVVTRIHCNIETSENFFPSICTTHTYKMKVEMVRLAKSMGFSVCSGGIIGMGESLVDRIQLALAGRAQSGIYSSECSYANFRNAF